MEKLSFWLLNWIFVKLRETKIHHDYEQDCKLKTFVLHKNTVVQQTLTLYLPQDDIATETKYLPFNDL